MVYIILSTGNISVNSKILTGLYLNFLALPFLIIAIYMFVLFSFEITNKILPKNIKIFYFLINFLEILLFINLIIKVNKYGGIIFSKIDYTFVVTFGNFTMILFVYFAIFQLIFFVKKIVDKRLKRNIRYFGLIYFSIYSVWFLFLLVYQDLEKIGFYPFYFLVYIINLFPVLFLKYKLHNILQIPSFNSLSEFQDLYKKYKITPKESEIIYLIREGKKNREIGDVLFISLQTVKNAISNIFRKINVQSRTELIKFFNQMVK